MRTQKTLTALLVTAALALGATTELRAADITGTWSWSQQGRGGQGGNADAPPRKMTLKLKADGEKLTGTLAQPGRRGQDGAAGTPTETEISDGKVKGDEISFSVKREFNGNQFVTKYNGKVDGNTIKGKVEAPGRQGGDPTTRDWEAKREAAAK